MPTLLLRNWEGVARGWHEWHLRRSPGRLTIFAFVEQGPDMTLRGVVGQVELDRDRFGQSVGMNADAITRLITEENGYWIDTDPVDRFPEAIFECRAELPLQRILELAGTEGARDGHPDFPLPRRQPRKQLRVKVHAKPSTAAVGADRIAVAELVIKTAVGHCREQRLVMSGVEHLLHVDMIERIVPEGASVDRGDKTVFDAFGSQVESMGGNLVHQLIP